MSNLFSDLPHLLGSISNLSIANELWRAYGGWKNEAGVEKKIKLQNGQWKDYY